MMNIRILGPGCDNCKISEAVARVASAATNVQAECIKVSGMK